METEDTTALPSLALSLGPQLYLWVQNPWPGTHSPWVPGGQTGSQWWDSIQYLPAGHPHPRSFGFFRYSKPSSTPGCMLCSCPHQTLPCGTALLNLPLHPHHPPKNSLSIKPWTRCISERPRLCVGGGAADGTHRHGSGGLYRNTGSVPGCVLAQSYRQDPTRPN